MGGCGFVFGCMPRIWADALQTAYSALHQEGIDPIEPFAHRSHTAVGANRCDVVEKVER